MSILILVVSSIAVLYLLFQLIKAGKQGRFVQTLRDLLIIFLAILMTAVIAYLAYLEIAEAKGNEGSALGSAYLLLISIFTSLLTRPNSFIFYCNINISIRRYFHISNSSYLLTYFFFLN